MSVLVIGKNKGWKQEANLGRKLNQSFVQLPFARFIQMLQYKAGSIGMKVVLTENGHGCGPLSGRAGRVHVSTGRRHSSPQA